MERGTYLAHHGIKGQKWGVRNYQNADGSLTPEGRARYLGESYDAPKNKNKTVFVSGSSKTQDKSSGYYLKRLPYSVRYELKEHMKRGDKIIVGDAPGIDRQTQDYLAKKNYTNVEVFSPGKEGARYLANPGWKQTNVDKPGVEIGSKEWLAAKDFVMSKLADKGIAVTIDEGAKATRKNVDRLVEANKEVMVYEIGRDRGRLGNLLGLRDNKATTFINGKEVSEGYYDGYWITDPDNVHGNVPEHEYGTRTKEISANKIAREQSLNGSKRWEDMNDSERGKAMNQLTDNIIGASKSGKARAEFSEPHKSSGRYTTGSKSNKSAERQMIARAKSLKDSGKTIEEVAELLGVPRSTAADYIYW